MKPEIGSNERIKPDGTKDGREFSLLCLSSGAIKLLATITMTIDHIGAALLPQYLFLRMIGRLAFPIYCYMIVNGMFHTRNCVKYILRLTAFALMAEVFFDLAFFNTAYHLEHQNVFFTLAIGLAVICVIEQIKLKLKGKLYFIALILELFVLFLGCFIAYVLKTDYSFYGILMIFGFYEFRFNAMVSCAFQIYINMYLIGGVQAYAIAAIPVIWMYNGEKGIIEKKLKWFFYLYYPVHLLIIYIIRRIV